MTTEYQNPVLPGFYPDPSICRVGADYYLVTSSFEYFPGVPIFHSRDLVHWRQIGHCLTRASQLPLENAKSSQGIFAPTLRHHRGTFYLVTTNISDGGNFYVTADDPAGEWSEPVWLREPVRGIDPSLLFDGDGRVYYTRQGGGERGEIFQAELDPRAGRLIGEVKPIWSGTGGIWPEGPHLYKIGNYYYLLISEGGTGYDHMLTVARAESPFGPFEPCPRNPILTHRDKRELPIQATGHGDLVITPEGEFFVVFLGIRPWDGEHHHLGRETFLAPLSWDDDGWPVVNRGEPIALRMKAALPPAAPIEVAGPRDDFSSTRLSMTWNFIRNPHERDWSLSARPGWLRLMGTRVTLDDAGSPAFVGRRQCHYVCRASALLDFSPANDGDEAGLTVRANEKNHYEIFVTRVNGRRTVRLRTRIDDSARTMGEAILPAGPVQLEVRAYADRYEFFASNAGAPPRALGAAATTPLSTESAGGFTGVYFGMYASAGSWTGASPADFDWFEYTPES